MRKTAVCELLQVIFQLELSEYEQHPSRIRLNIAPVRGILAWVTLCVQKSIRCKRGGAKKEGIFS